MVGDKLQPPRLDTSPFVDANFATSSNGPLDFTFTQKIYGAELAVANALQNGQAESLDTPFMVVFAMMGFGAMRGARCAHSKIISYAQEACHNAQVVWFDFDAATNIDDEQIIWLFRNHLKLDENVAWEIVRNTYLEVYASEEVGRHGIEYARKLFLLKIRESYSGGMQEIHLNNRPPARFIQLLISKINAWMGR